MGTFGGITQFRSLVKNRTDFFDIAASGPVVGGAVALGLFLAGLASSAGGGEGLLPVPAQLFQGSLLLGTICQGILGIDPGNTKEVRAV